MEKRGFKHFFKRFGISSIMFIVFILVSIGFLLWYLYGSNIRSDVVWEYVIIGYIIIMLIIPLMVFVAQVLLYYFQKKENKNLQIALIIIRMIPTIVLSVELFVSSFMGAFLFLFGLLSFLGFSLAGVYETRNIYKEEKKTKIVEEPVTL